MAIARGTTEHAGTFEAPAHGHAAGTVVRMTCYTAGRRGTLQPDTEIEEVVWLTYADRPRVSHVDQFIVDHSTRQPASTDPTVT